jgi:hypothetical protein
MGDIVYKMLYQPEEGFPGFSILLAAILAIFPRYGSTAVQAVFIFSLLSVRQVLNFVKNKANENILGEVSCVNTWLIADAS